MAEQLPLFPLNAVVFPGVALPLHVFEDRYRSLVHHLLSIPDTTMRLFGIVAIREGYEVGGRGAAKQSLHRVGCVVQLTSVEGYEDGRFDIEVVGRHRMQLRDVDASGAYLVGDVEALTERPSTGPARTGETAREAARTLGTFEDYRRRLTELSGGDVLGGAVPQDPELLSFTLAATCLLTLQERQSLLEAESARERLAMLRHTLLVELRAMRAVPSLPATDVARTGWSPN